MSYNMYDLTTLAFSNYWSLNLVGYELIADVIQNWSSLTLLKLMEIKLTPNKTKVGTWVLGWPFAYGV